MVKKKRTDLWGAMTDEDADAVMAAMLPMAEEVLEASSIEEIEEIEETPTFLNDIKDL